MNVPPRPLTSSLVTHIEQKSARRSGQPTRPTPSAPLGTLVQQAMNRLGLSYQRVVTESSRLASLNANPDMRIGKSTLGNIISGSIRQPSTAKLDTLRILLHLTRQELDVAIGLAPERRFIEQLQLKSSRTHEVSPDAVTRHRKVKIPLVREPAQLNSSQFLDAIVQRWSTVEVEYLSSFYPPHLRYVVIGEADTHAAPVAPPGTRLIVNTLVTRVRPAENISFHERELYCILTRLGLTCCYLEHTPTGRMILVPHPLSGNVREELNEDVSVLGLVVGILLQP